MINEFGQYLIPNNVYLPSPRAQEKCIELVEIKMRMNTRIACERTGMPLTHAACFQEVANETGCVISIRAVGKHATGLILEGYASKGFHIKAKSCNWGPMAGFVLNDPRFTKRGTSKEAQAAQAKDIRQAFNAGAQEMQVFLSEARCKQLIKMDCMTFTGKKNRDGQEEESYFARPPDNIAMHFVLRKQYAPGAEMPMWALYYGKRERALHIQPDMLDQPEQIKAGNLVPVNALVNPDCTEELRGTYRSATTGDYDLWGVFPPSADFSPNGRDRRLVPGSHRFRESYKKYMEFEDANKGNMTPRLTRISEIINAKITSAGYEGGNMVHHSDEVGRPGVKDVDFPFISFVPNETQAYLVRTHDELAQFRKAIITTHHMTMNPGWEFEKKVTAGLHKSSMQQGMLLSLHHALIDKEFKSKQKICSTPKGNWEV